MAKPLGQGTWEDHVKRKALYLSLFKAMPQITAIINFMGSKKTGARCLSPCPGWACRRGPFPPCSLYFRQSSDITANLFSLSKLPQSPPIS